ncbi:MAG: CHRD domain-containing protein, partial [Saprospiraceae bacterium]
HDVGMATFRAHLSGSNEVPVVTTAANGMLIATLVNDTTLAVSGAFMDLESDLATEIAGGAHLHLGVAGATGNVIFPLNISNNNDARNGTFAKANNTFTITAEQKAALYNREIYVNIHSANHPMGELRGQLLPESQVIFNGHLSGVFQNTPVSTKANGAVKVELLGNQMTVSGSFTDLSSSVATEIAGGAHIHLGVAGRNGAVEFPLDMRLNGDLTTGRFLANANTFTLTDAQVANLKARRNYVNIHTANFQSGELRGQLLPEATTYFLAALGGNSEVPAVDTEATGTAIVEVNGNNAILTGSYANLASDFNANLAGGAHLHTAYAGSNGGIAQLVASTPDSNTSGTFNASDNQFALSVGLLDTLRERGIYLNIHSVENAGGEIRGQLLPLGTTYFTTNLLRSNDVQPVPTNAQGGLKLELTNNILTVTGSFNNLSGDFDADIAGGAHLHIATPAENGDVTLLLNTTLTADNRSGFYAATENTFTLDDAQVAALCAGNFYANIHTETFASGELRGQILPEINFFPQGNMAITQPDNAENIITTNDPATPFQVRWNAAMDRDPLVYIWQLATDEAFTNVLLQQNVGFNPTVNLTLGAVDTLLIDNGIAEGENRRLYHRAIASDGSLQQVGAFSSVNLIREAANEFDYVAILTGQNEVLPVATTAYGEVYAELDGNQLILEGFFENLTAPVATNIAGGAHIHLGYAGENGDIVFPIELNIADNGTGGTIEREDNTFTLNGNQQTQLAGRQLYINLHSEQFTGGEIRGQFLPIGNEPFVANLFGNNEVPAIISEGHGSLLLDVAGNQLTVSGAFNDLEGAVDTDIAGGAHLHLGVAGSNGEVTLPLNITLQGNDTRGKFFPEDNVFTLDNEQLAALRNHGLYANIHTEDFPTGELRGQVAPQARTNFRAHLSGSNEVPVVTSFATGQINALMINDSTLVVSGSINNLESDLNTQLAGGAHLHFGYAGETGDIAFPLELQIDNNQRSAIISAEDNVFIINAGIQAQLYQRALYINVHSVANAAGELRGQLLPESQIVFNGFLSGVFETPAVSTSALGGLKVELSGDQITVTGSFNNLSSPVDESIAGGAHLHIAPAGRNGDVFVILEPNLTNDGRGGNFLAVNNTFTLNAEQMFRLTGREVYANIHSTEEATGELRAQLLPEATTYFVAPLSGASVVPATNTDATGMAIAEINGDQLTLSGSYMDLSSTIAANVAGGTHLHSGLAGQIGERLQILSPASDASGTGGVFNVFGNTFSIDDTDRDALRKRSQYVDIHTLENTDGELRGQLLPLATTYFHTSLDGWNEVQPVATTGVGGLKLELTDNILTVSGAFTDLVSDFDQNIGAHLHLGNAGENGAVTLPLIVENPTDLRNGIVPSLENFFELTDEQIAALRNGKLYANFHSTDFPMGELRGQIVAEINDFPSRSATINTPATGSTITIDGAPSTPFRASWQMARDRDNLAYIWQLSTDAQFSNLLANQNVGTTLEFVTDFATVDAILENAGIEAGESVMLFHRAVATDG